MLKRLPIKSCILRNIPTCCKDNRDNSIIKIGSILTLAHLGDDTYSDITLKQSLQVAGEPFSFVIKVIY